MSGAQTVKQRRDRLDARSPKPPSLTPRAALQNPRNIPYIDGFGILKLPEDPGILRNSSELFENSRNFTRFLFCKVSPSGRRANATNKRNPQRL